VARCRAGELGVQRVPRQHVLAGDGATQPAPGARPRRFPEHQPRPTDSGAATAALIAGAADSKDIVDDACAKKAIAELIQELI
jgi:hypothetical protein